MQSSDPQQTQARPNGAVDDPEALNEPAGTTGFFDRHDALGAEIVGGMIREGQLVVFAGPFGVAKTPLLIDITLHVLNGRAWNGRTVQKRPMVVFDFESAGPAYKRNVKNIAARLKVPIPRVPGELEVYLEHDDSAEPATAKLLKVLESDKVQDRLDLLEETLRRKPNALVIIDPLEMLFRIDTGKKTNILWLYTRLKLLLTRFPHAALILVFNMRKGKQGDELPDLLTSPRAFLQEVCGTLDILNRSDVRLGMGLYGDDTRVVNGIRRGEPFDPLLLRTVGDADNLAGFELAPPDDTDLVAALTAKQWTYWNALPHEFSFDAVADKTVPRSSLSRLVQRAKSLGRLIHDEKAGVWRKVSA